MYKVTELKQRNEMFKNGTQVEGFPLKLKVGFFTKPYISTYNHQEFVFRCRDSFRKFWPNQSNKNFYVLLTDKTEIINGRETPVYKPEDLQKPVRIFYAGDDQRVALKDEVIYSTQGATLSGHITQGMALVNGAMLKRKGTDNYLSTAMIEIYCPESRVEELGITKADLYKIKERWVSLRCIGG